MISSVDGSSRVIVYYKGDITDKDTMNALGDLYDEVVPLANIGGVGETYLAHITRHYNSASFANQTFFVRPHLDLSTSGSLLDTRLKHVAPSTGFMSFGPYFDMADGVDGHKHFPRISDTYAMFRHEFRPPGPLLATRGNEFVVSKSRILDNSFEAYDNWRRLFHAPFDHWIWTDERWNSATSASLLSDALERSWCYIFGFTDHTVAETCGTGSGATCQDVDRDRSRWKSIAGRHNV